MLRFLMPVKTVIWSVKWAGFSCSGTVSSYALLTSSDISPNMRLFCR